MMVNKIKSIILLLFFLATLSCTSLKKRSLDPTKLYYTKRDSIGFNYYGFFRFYNKDYVRYIGWQYAENSKVNFIKMYSHLRTYYKIAGLFGMYGDTATILKENRNTIILEDSIIFYPKEQKVRYRKRLLDYKAIEIDTNELNTWEQENFFGDYTPPVDWKTKKAKY